MRAYELGTFCRCQPCLEKVVTKPLPSGQYVPPIVLADEPWRKQIAEVLQAQFQLEMRFWQTKPDSATTWLSMSCPFSAAATEGPIGVLKGIQTPHTNRRLECMLRTSCGQKVRTD